MLYEVITRDDGLTRPEFGVITFQAEDEIAGVGSALGAAFAGALGVTTTSGPGIDLKAEITEAQAATPEASHAGTVPADAVDAPSDAAASGPSEHPFKALMPRSATSADPRVSEWVARFIAEDEPRFGTRLQMAVLGDVEAMVVTRNNFV